MSISGILFDIKHFAIHDGPGTRTTVFFKGCPLSCWWCHNPESQAAAPQLVFHPQRCLEGCSDCLGACPAEALSGRGPQIAVDRGRCRLCGECSQACPTEALAIIGRSWTADEVMEEIVKDRLFYDQSGGGATFSGGEPLAQPEFLAALLAACRSQGIHTAVDTCGHASWETLRAVADLADLFLYDIKLIDERRHAAVTGVGNRLILGNLARLAALAPGRVQARLPLIPGITDDQENLTAIAAYLKRLKTIREVALLNYHRGGRQKYRKVSLPDHMAEAAPLATGRVEAVQDLFHGRGFRVSIGG